MLQIFAERLKYLREEKNLSQVQLSKLTGISNMAISNWERNNREISASFLIRLAVFFDVTVDYLLGLENEYGTKTTPKIY